MAPVIQVFPDLPTLVATAADLVSDRILQAVATKGRCSIALAGGSTPKPLYETLAGRDLPWDKLWIFWGDERYVSPDHPDSNQRMARLAWLNQVPIPADQIFPLETEDPEPAAAALLHEAKLRSVFQSASPAIPLFDIILLGLGDDGHTASLFPHTPALNVDNRLITVGEKSGQPRLTFTYPLINQAACVLFLVAGASKQPALRQILIDQGDPAEYPARGVDPQGDLYWFLDAAAGQDFS
jgi:6-phosphogluconolactonase